MFRNEWAKKILFLSFIALHDAPANEGEIMKKSNVTFVTVHMYFGKWHRAVLVIM